MKLIKKFCFNKGWLNIKKMPVQLLPPEPARYFAVESTLKIESAIGLNHPILHDY